MLKIQIALLLWGFSLLKHASWTSKFLDNAEQLKAVCSDGSTPRYFTSLSETNSSLWILYLLGGAGCSNEEMCVDRLTNTPFFTSSKGYTGQYPASEGIFERDCELNPQFCNGNFVVPLYCSSDWWTGDNTFIFKNSKEPGQIHFRGFNIVHAVINQLLKDTTLPSATTFVMSGTSAGGVGAMNLADRVHSYLKPNLQSLTNFKTIIDAALFLGNPVYRPLPCSMSFFCSVERTYREGVKIWKSKLDESCMDELKEEDEWRCLMVDPGVRFVETPSIILINKYDLWQWMSDGDQGYPGGMAHLLQRGDQVVEVVKGLISSKSVQSAVVSSCFYHTFVQYKEEFLEFKIEGKRVADAVREFVFEDKQSYMINECQGFGCNEKCSNLQQFHQKDIQSLPEYPWKKSQ